MIGCWRSADPGGLRALTDFWSSLLAFPGLNIKGASESWLAAVPGPESFGTSSDGQSNLIDRIP